MARVTVEDCIDKVENRFEGDKFILKLIMPL